MKILLVAPYLDLVKTAEEALSQTPYQIRIVFGDLQEGLQAASGETIRNSPDVVISRGGTASLLRKNLTIPVFEIDVTIFDLLRVIYPHIRKQRKVAVVGYENVVNGARTLAQILEIELGYFLLDSQGDIETVIQAARDWGAEVLVGDAVSVKTARDRNWEAELIRSGPEAILSTVEAAARFYDHMQDEIIRNKRLNSILEHAEKGVLYLNSQGSVELINLKAEKILKLNRYQVVGHRFDSLPLPEVLTQAIREESHDKLIRIDEKDYLVDIHPLQSDIHHFSTLVFLQSAGYIRDMDILIRRQMVNRGLVANYTFGSIITEDARFRKTIEKAQQYSKTNSTILLLGETGVGKEMFAQSIHNASSRREGPFVGLNCAALPDSLLESELFGYAEGAFTGARKGGKPGLFETAHTGTIFLDEVNDMSKDVQARLLRVLQEKQVMRVGDNRIFDVDVRVIAASNKNLAMEAEEGRFRKDLFYRLKVLDIEIISLRERRKDIIPLFSIFLQQFMIKGSPVMEEIPDRLASCLLEYSWPGNIRELKNFAEKASVLLSLDSGNGDTLEDLVEELMRNIRDQRPEAPDELPAGKTLREKEAEFIRLCLEKNGNNLSLTARELGIDRATLRKKLTPA